MTDDHPATSADAFEAMYRGAEDPWDFSSSAYERGRYAAILGALSRPRYARAYEPGCSIGELTVQLAERCDDVVAVDIAPTAVARARRRCAGLAHVHISVGHVAEHFPAGNFDLIVFSELGYYFTEAELRSLIAALAHRVGPGGEFVAAHWLGRSEDHVQHGDAVHEALRSHLPMEWSDGARHPGFRIDRWRRP